MCFIYFDLHWFNGGEYFTEYSSGVVSLLFNSEICLSTIYLFYLSIYYLIITIIYHYFY